MNVSFFLLLLILPSLSAISQDFDRRERTYDVLHYDIRVRLDEARKTVHGDIRVTLRGLRASHPSYEAWTGDAVLDAVNMRIDSVWWSRGAGMERNAVLMRRVEGIHRGSSGAVWSYDSAKLALQFRGSDQPLTPEDTVTVRVRYSCRPQKGLYFIQPDASFPGDPRQIWTQGQGEDNRHWIPCYDYPNDKATSEIRMTVDTALRTLSNGRLLARRDNGDGTATWHWSLDKPHSSYLIMLAAGKYGVFEEEWDGIPVQSWHYHSDNPADVRRTFEDTDAMVAYFSEFLGVRYPWNKYAQIPVAHFPYGGMENTTATVMADTRLVVDARTALDYDPQPLIAHELAHQWTGDYVTYADWRNEWLNEGFATFLQQMWTKERFGFEDFLLQRFNGIRSYVDWTDRDGRLPVVHRTSTSSANTYSKGAAVLHMMMDILGEKDFRRVLNAWLVRHAYGSVETNDLKRTIEEVTGRNLQWFFEQWLYKAGYPEIEITREPLADGSGLRIMYRQVQKTDSLCGYFRMPIDVWILQPDAGQDCVQILSKSIAGPETADTIPVPAGKYFVLFDPTRGICGRVHVDYTAAERAALLALSLDEPEAHGKFIPAPWRILLAERLAADAGAMVQERIRSILFDIAERDPVPEVRKAVATKLAEISPQAVDYADDLREVFLRLRRDPFSGVRATAVNGLNNFRDAALLPFFRDMLTDSSYFVEASAMNGILALDSTGAVDILRMRLQSRSYQDVLALAALDWVRRYRLSSLQDLVLNLAGPGHSAPLRAKAFETLLDLRVAAERIRELILRQLEEPRAAFRLYAVSALQLFGKEEARRVLGSRLPLEDNPRVRALIRELYQL